MHIMNVASHMQRIAKIYYLSQVIKDMSPQFPEEYIFP